MATTIIIPRRVAERVHREAEKLGISVEEYLLELLTQNLDPLDKALEYIDISRELLEEANKELEKGNIRRAAEKTWGATALAIKAYAYHKEQRRLESHADLWRYKDVVAQDLGEWIADVFRQACSMHTCFYEGWCTEKDVGKVLSLVEKLVLAIMENIKRETKVEN